MLRADFLELVRNGENSGVEFKRDDVHPDELARAISCLLNLEGGRILLGVDDDGSITGLTRDPRDTEQWVINICRNNLQPPVIPYWETLQVDNHPVGVIFLPADSSGKPYKARRGTHWEVFLRVGSTCREPSREEEQRLHQSAGLLRYDLKAIPGSSIADLDLQRLNSYFHHVRKQDLSFQPEDNTNRERLLVNVDLLTDARGAYPASIAGLLLFGKDPNRYLPQAGITATAFSDVTKTYSVSDEEIIRGPLVSLLDESSRVVESGVIDRAIDFVQRNMGSQGRLDRGRRIKKDAYPLEAVREAIVNAVAHRDYTIWTTDIELSLYQDRLEIISPGRPPNGMTVEKMRAGARATRNELLKDILRDYGYIEGRGMGIPAKLIPLMKRHNGTDPDILVDDERLLVRLFQRAS